MTRWAALLALAAAGCGGRAVGNRSAVWCLNPNLNAEEKEHAIGAGSDWAEASEGEVSFGFVDGSDCDYEILRTERHGPNDGGMNVCGVSSPCIDRIELYVTLEGEHLRWFFRHEFGHFLTGGDHSDDRGDVMFPFFRGQAWFSDADLERLDRLSSERMAAWR